MKPEETNVSLNHSRPPRYYPHKRQDGTPRPIADIRGSHKCNCFKCRCKVRCYKSRKICIHCQKGNHTTKLTHRY